MIFEHRVIIDVGIKPTITSAPVFSAPSPLLANPAPAPRQVCVNTAAAAALLSPRAGFVRVTSPSSWFSPAASPPLAAASMPHTAYLSSADSMVNATPYNGFAVQHSLGTSWGFDRNVNSALTRAVDWATKLRHTLADVRHAIIAAPRVGRRMLQPNYGELQIAVPLVGKPHVMSCR